MGQRNWRNDTKQGRPRTASARSPAERLEPGRAPMRPRGLEAREPSRAFARTVRVVSAIFTLALVAMVSLATLGFGVYHQFEAPGPLTETRTIVIPRGEGRIAIAERLEREGIITNRWTFVGGQILSGFLAGRKSNELKAGEYELGAGASMRDVLTKLSEGKSILYKVTVPEGLTSEQIVARLRGDSNLSGEINAIPPEGTLLPDTYLVSKGTARIEIINRMTEAMQKLVGTLWEKRGAELPLRSPEEAITFASIVEKETGQPNERARVAAVFQNRLKKGMRLQSDPTIIYGLVGGEGSLGRPITKSDIASKTAYNTYRINGLPPGPIANPGKDSLEATFNPAQTNDLYFVADGTGGHTFSETLDQHNAAVRDWRKLEAQDDDDASAAPADAATPNSAVAKQTAAAPSGATAAATDDSTADSGAADDGAGPKPLLIHAPPPAPKRAAETAASDGGAIKPVIVNSQGGDGTAAVATPAAAPAADIPLPVRRPRTD